tara:strand:+ start:451 stop:849 length:399 start_codon:yes stop_codon:yes gene_type:complete
MEKISNSEYEGRARRLANLNGERRPLFGRNANVFSQEHRDLYVINYLGDGEISGKIEVLYQGNMVLKSGQRGVEKFEDGSWKGLLTQYWNRAEKDDAERRRKEAERFKGQIDDSMRPYDPFGSAVRKSVGPA